MDGATWAYHLPDALGSVRQVVDGAGSLASNWEWTPFGVEVGAARVGLGFTGEWGDSNIGMVYLRARWLNPQTGQFVSQDPSSGFLLEPSSLHNYSYVEQNPILYADPTGYQRETPYPPTGKADCNTWPPTWFPYPYNQTRCRQAECGPFQIAARAEIYWGLATAGTLVHPEAARNIRHFLMASGKTMEFNSDWLASFAVVQETERLFFNDFVEQDVVPQIKNLTGGDFASSECRSGYKTE